MQTRKQESKQETRMPSVEARAVKLSMSKLQSYAEGKTNRLCVNGRWQDIPDTQLYRAYQSLRDGEVTCNTSHKEVITSPGKSLAWDLLEDSKVWLINQDNKQELDRIRRASAFRKQLEEATSETAPEESMLDFPASELDPE